MTRVRSFPAAPASAIAFSDALHRPVAVLGADGAGSRPNAAWKRASKSAGTAPAAARRPVCLPDGQRLRVAGQAAVAARRDLEDARGVEQRHGHRASRRRSRR